MPGGQELTKKLSIWIGAVDERESVSTKAHRDIGDIGVIRLQKCNVVRR